MSTLNVIKRNGNIEEFDIDKLRNAIQKCTRSINKENSSDIVDKITDEVFIELSESDGDFIEVEEIQDFVENKLMEYNLHDCAKEYILYRDLRRRVRDQQARQYEEAQKTISDIMNIKNIENSNANVDEASFSGKNAKVQGHFLKEYALNNLMQPEVAEGHRSGLLYTHDLDNYASGQHNCLTIDFEDLFSNNGGFETRNGDVRQPGGIGSFFQLVAVVFQCQSQVA